MSVLDTIKKRRSIREFEARGIPEEAVDVLVDALIWAPSAGNLQSRKFFFVFDQKKKNMLADASGNPDFVARAKKIIKKILNKNFVSQAPLVVVACLDRNIINRYGERGVHLYAIQDSAASIMNMLLAAYELGLGSVWVGGFDEEKVAAALDIPEHLRPVALIPIGYPARIPAPPLRKSGDEVVEMLR